MNAIKKYLKNYAEPECSALQDFPDHCRYQHCVIIPAYDETPNFIDRLICSEGLLQSNRALAIVVINQPDTVASSPTNRQLEEYLTTALPGIWQQNNLTLLGTPHWGILMVERYRSQPIPRKQGVGLARKIAADLCVQLIDSAIIERQWIHSTDADAHLPMNYFAAAENLEAAALTYKYHHRQTGSMACTATQLYQTSLDYYVEGLHWAQSPYAFHTLGSIIAADYIAYCQVRGFPKRAGGEDFYLLNKLAKLGHIVTPDSEIELEPRVSHRVPFGTGPAVEKILSTQQQGIARTDYAPEIFAHLKQLLRSVSEIFATGGNLTEVIAELPECTQNALQDLRATELNKHLKNKTPEQKLTHFHLWFDGFRTLKFVHYLQRHNFPAVPLTALPKEVFQSL